MKRVYFFIAYILIIKGVYKVGVMYFYYQKVNGFSFSCYKCKDISVTAKVIHGRYLDYHCISTGLNKQKTNKIESGVENIRFS